MSSNWNSDTIGILRKSNHTTTQQQQNADTNRSSDLLVFGYACKIFRDDEKAIYIDQGKHLIPWMGDDSLKIDRYDVRATLSDLTQYEPPPGGYINRLDYLSPAEQRAEQLCEEERYYSLYHNEEEEEMYQEEELKRLQQQTSSSTTYGQVQFDYNQSTEQSESQSSIADDNKSDEPDEVYTPPLNLNVPESIETPETMKLHAIIEKTAKFISTQGPQMEILIKAKQSNNPQFEFLNINNRLNPYYKFILELFKNGTYPIQPEEQENAEKLQTADNNQHDCPVTGNFTYASIPAPPIKYKPSANCSYTQLISKIKGVPLPPEQPLPEEPNLEATTPTLLTHFAHYQPQQNYGVPIAAGAMENSLAVTTTATTLANEQRNDNGSKDKPIPKTEGVEIKQMSSGLALAQCYASDTEEENECSETDQSHSQSHSEELVLKFPIPPDNLRHIIDKTATYVIKNGQQFEDILRVKNDERFLFLNPSDEYHQYYMYKVTGIAYPYPTSNGIVDDVDSSKPKAITPVSFSIKAKDDAPVSMKPALPQETSDDELESKDDKTATTPTPTATTNTVVSNQNVNQQQNPSINPVTKATVPEHVQRAIQLVESQLMSRGAQYAAAAAAVAASSAVGSAMTVSNNTTTGLKESTLQKSKFDLDTTVSLPTTPLTSVGKVENVQQKELKRAEEKVKDRLAQIAREKLGLISKEKQLQLERKKKAMAFLNQIKSSGVSIISSDQHENENARNIDVSDSDSDSVHSVPISSPHNEVNDDRISEVTEINNGKGKFEAVNRSKDYEETPENCEIVQKRIRSRSPSRSRSRSSKQRSSSYKHKKKSKHSKKKSKKKSRSRSRCRTKSVVKVAVNNRDGSGGSSSGGGGRGEDYHHHHRRQETSHSSTTHRDRKHKRRHSTSPSRKSKKKKRD